MARFSDDACECLRILTIPSDSSAAPGLRLPGWLHCQEGFRPWTVAFPPPVQRLLPWNTCRERQGLVRFPTLSSGECDFMSQLTTQAQRPGPRDAWIATWTRWPGSLQRMVELSRYAAGESGRVLVHRRW